MEINREKSFFTKNILFEYYKRSSVSYQTPITPMFVVGQKNTVLWSLQKLQNLSG